MKRKWIKGLAVFCGAVLFAQSFSGMGSLVAEAAASDYAEQSNVFLDAGGYKTVPYGTVTSDYMNTYKERADVLPKLENTYLTDGYRERVATVPTSDWGASIVFDQFSESLYVHPMVFRTTSAGVEMATPEVIDVLAPRGDGEPAVESLLEDSSVELVLGGEGFTAVDARVDVATDWTYDVSMKDSSGKSEIYTTLAKGSPYVYYQFTEVTPTLSLGAGATDMEIYLNNTSSNNIGISVTELMTVNNEANIAPAAQGQTHYYGVYAPAGTTWTNAGGKLTANLPAGKNWITIAALPDGSQNTFETYATYAANRISNTIVEWDYSEAYSLVTTVYNFETTNMDTGATGGDTIIALYPHQWRYAVDKNFTGYKYETIRGTMETYIGNKYTTEMTYNGIISAMPTPVSEEGLGTLKNQISYWWDYYQNTCNGTYTEAGDWQYGGYDTYWMGKNFNKRADVIYMAEQIEDDSEDWKKIKADIYNALKADLQYWFNPADVYTVDKDPYITGFFYYYDDFGTLIGYNSSYSSDSELNDHHFHYGYWVKAAAAVAQYYENYRTDEEADKWEKEWGAIVYEMISDFANPNRDGTSLNEQRTDNPIDTNTNYPFLRNFDIYEGHSWASGIANYELDANGNVVDVGGGLQGGNNQESTSEAVNAWSSLILWGETVGDERIRDLGVYLYTTEVATIEEYYFDVHDEVFTDAYEDEGGFDIQVVTRLFGGRYDHTAWWTEDPIEVTTIHMIPTTGSTLYFSKYPDKIKDTINSISESSKQWQNYLATKNNIGGNDWLTSRYTHHDLLAEFYALADPSTAMGMWSIEDVGGQTIIEAGESRPHTYGYIQSMIEFGTPNYSITGSQPLSMVFTDEEGNHTYVAQNFSDEDMDVYFSDGTYITVPANGSYSGAAVGTGNNPEKIPQVSYKLETYLQNVEKNGYDLVETSDKADEGSFTLVPEEIDGFTFDEDNTNNVLSAELVAGQDNAVTLKVYYDRNSYAINYNLNEGTNAAGNPSEYVYGTTVELENPTREGYRFMGWYTDEAFTQEFTGVSEITFGDITLYARWMSEKDAFYTVNVYMQDTGRTGYNCVTTETLTGEIGTTVSYSYAGDTTGFTLNAEITDAEGTITRENDLVLSVYYDRNTYRVSYGNMDGVTNAVGNADYYVYGVGMSFASPSKEGFTFGGWYTDSACTDGNEMDSISTSATGDVTVYAKWTETPEFSGDNGDTNISRDDITVTYDASTKHVTVTLSNQTRLTEVICYIAAFTDESRAKEACEAATAALPGISLDGHLGIKLNVSSDGTTASKEISEISIEEGGYVVFGLNINGYLSKDSAFYYYKAGGQTLTSYTVNHLQQNVSLDSYSLAESKVVSNVPAGKSVTANANTYDGFNFNADISTASGTTTVDGGLILNLYYDRNQYDIIYNGLEDATNPNPAKYSHGVGLILQEPRRSGYTFAGWYTDEACTEGNEITAIPNTSIGTVTVYAKWTEGGGTGGGEQEETVNYTVNYYLQNTALNGYTMMMEEAVSGTAIAGETVEAEIKTFDGFTYDADASTVSASAEEDLELKVYYNRNQYNVIYNNMDGVTNPNAATYIYGVGLKLKSPVKDGYTFDGWYTDSAFATDSRVTSISDTQMGDVTLYAKWTEEVYAALYTVEYYLQDKDLNGYTKQDMYTMRAYGEVGETIQASLRDFEGFSCNTSASTLSGEVSADETLILKVYYDRNKYTITYENMSGATFTENAATSYVYGIGADLVEAQKNGYRFKGWYTDRNFDETSKVAAISAVSTGDITVYAKWAGVDLTYQVKHYLQNETLDGYEEITSDTKTLLAEENEEVAAEANTYTGFTYNEGASTASGEVKTNNGLVLKLYYDRDTYNIAYELDGGTNHADNKDTYAYNVPVTFQNPEKEGYTFGGWYTDSAFAEERKISGISAGSTGDITVYAKWLDSSQAAEYTTKYYLQNVTMDGYDEVTADTVVMSGSTGTTVSAPAKEYPGFVKNPNAEGYLESGVVASDGHLVLKVYYDRFVYDIVYHGVEDATNPSATQYYYGVEMTLDEPYKEDYRFDGWYLAEDLSEEKLVTTIAAGTTGTIELWAKWTSKSELTWIVDEVKDFDYTGKKITPEVIVRDKDTGHKLQVNKDYKVKYSNNTNVGTATIEITGKGNYAGSRFVNFEILPIDLEASDNVLVDTIYKFTNNGKAVKVTPTVKLNGKKLKLNKDYKIDTTVEGSQLSYTETGVYDVVLIGIGNYVGSVTTEFVLTDKATTVLISKAKVSGFVKSMPYSADMAEYVQELTLTYTNKGVTTELEEGTHYELEYRNNTQSGTAELVIKGLDYDEDLKFTGSKTMTYKIQGQKIAAKNIVLDSTSYTYCGYEIEPEVTIMVDGSEVPQDQYTVTYTNNINKGKGTVTVTGVDGYQGTAKKNFTIAAMPLSAEEIDIVVDEEATYVKGGAKAAVEVMHNGEMLSENVDYTLKYSNNKASGTATVKITGKGNYTGSPVRTFMVEKKSIDEVTLLAADITYNSKKKMSYYFAKPQLVDEDGTVLAAGKDYSKTFKYELLGDYGEWIEISKTSDVSQISVGDEIRITVTGSGEYTESISAIYRVIEPAQSISKARITIKPQIYTGDAITISKADVLSVEVKINGSYVTLEDEDYEIVDGSYKNNIKKGTAKVTIRGVGEYGGSKEATFKIQSKNMEDTNIWIRMFRWLFG